MRVVRSKVEREAHWHWSVSEGCPYVVYQPRLMYGLFAYDMRSAGRRLTIAASAMVKDRFDALAMRYNSSATKPSASGKPHRVTATRGHICVMEEDIVSMAEWFEELLSNSDLSEEEQLLEDDINEPWVEWPKLGGSF